MADEINKGTRYGIPRCLHVDGHGEQCTGFASRSEEYGPQVCKEHEKQRITVQTYSMIDGSCREVVANVTAEDEQSAVDKLFAIAKDEIAYKFLGVGGYIKPSSLPVPPVAIPRTVGEWYVKA